MKTRWIRTWRTQQTRLPAAQAGAAFTTLPIAELVTMHGSKGLEYDAVFLPCCMEGVVPHKKSKNQAALEEERRMFYVGITRAKKRAVSVVYERNKGNAGVCVPVSC